MHRIKQGDNDPITFPKSAITQELILIYLPASSQATIHLYTTPITVSHSKHHYPTLDTTINKDKPCNEYLWLHYSTTPQLKQPDAQQRGFLSYITSISPITPHISLKQTNTPSQIARSRHKIGSEHQILYSDLIIPNLICLQGLQIQASPPPRT